MDRGKRLIVAVDGPSGAGKGTVARATARALGYTHVDTGAMYRAVAWRPCDPHRHSTPPSGSPRVARAASSPSTADAPVIDGHDVTEAIRTPAIDMAAARGGPQRRRAGGAGRASAGDGAGGGVVMEGRDIGTVVFPAADVKVYLDASPDERARRRAADPAHSGGGTDVRPRRRRAWPRATSRTRAAASRRSIRAADAVYIDTTGMPIDAGGRAGGGAGARTSSG